MKKSNRMYQKSYMGHLSNLICFMVVRHASVKLGVADDIWFLEQSKIGIN